MASDYASLRELARATEEKKQRKPPALDLSTPTSVVQIKYDTLVKYLTWRKDSNIDEAAYETVAIVRDSDRLSAVGFTFFQVLAVELGFSREAILGFLGGIVFKATALIHDWHKQLMDEPPLMEHALAVCSMPYKPRIVARDFYFVRGRVDVALMFHFLCNHAYGAMGSVAEKEAGAFVREEVPVMHPPRVKSRRQVYAHDDLDQMSAKTRYLVRALLFERLMREVVEPGLNRFWVALTDGAYLGSPHRLLVEHVSRIVSEHHAKLHVTMTRLFKSSSRSKKKSRPHDSEDIEDYARFFRKGVNILPSCLQQFAMDTQPRDGHPKRMARFFLMTTLAAVFGESFESYYLSILRATIHEYGHKADTTMNGFRKEASEFRKKGVFSGGFNCSTVQRHQLCPVAKVIAQQNPRVAQARVFARSNFGKVHGSPSAKGASRHVTDHSPANQICGNLLNAVNAAENDDAELVLCRKPSDFLRSRIQNRRVWHQIEYDEED